MFELFSDDITFCGSSCSKTDCFRHPSNMKQPEFPHSFAFFKGTDDCPDEEMQNPKLKNADYHENLNNYIKEFKKRTGMI